MGESAVRRERVTASTSDLVLDSLQSLSNGLDAFGLHWTILGRFFLDEPNPSRLWGDPI